MNLEEAKHHLENVQRELKKMKEAHLTVTPKYRALKSIEELLLGKIDAESK